jgi:hypothetical protein
VSGSKAITLAFYLRNKSNINNFVNRIFEQKKGIIRNLKRFFATFLPANAH